MGNLRNFKVELFKALSHNHRISIIDTLREGELSVGSISNILSLESSYISQQLSILKNKNIVDARKEGKQIFYSIKDEAIFGLLDAARLIFDNHLIDLKASIKQL